MHYLHRLSGFCFYILGLSGFVAFLFTKNNLWAGPSSLWLQIADLPFALSALTYGGLGFYFSLSGGQKRPVLGTVTFIVLAVIFGVIMIGNFWGLFAN